MAEMQRYVVTRIQEIYINAASAADARSMGEATFKGILDIPSLKNGAKAEKIQTVSINVAKV